MPRIVLYTFALALCFVGSNVFAQGALTELYGEGVHRYFAGDLIGADQLFTKVIDSGSDDPRAYYFRGLVRANQGGDGTSDFETGARMEAEGKTAVNVGFALSRIQGHVRAKIEEARRNARVVARQQALVREQARLSAPTPDASTPPAAGAPDVAPATGSEPAAPDPFSSGEGLRSDATTVDPVQPTPPEVDSLSNPFGDDPVPADPATPAADAPASNPFGDPAPADADNPFGGATDPAPMDNPFGN